jgi:MYXO-CTERM domain-containing protein
MSLQHQASSITSIRLAAALAALTAVLAGAPEAAACECAGRGGAQPSSTSTKVPTNTKVWMLQMACNGPTVRNINGADVPGSVTTLRELRVFHPDAPLEVGSTYEIIGCFDNQLATFTVNEGPDEEPPPRPAVTPLDAESGSGGAFSSCGGEYEYVPLLASRTDVILTLDIAGRADLNPEAVNGEVSDVFLPNHRPLVGSADCEAFNWDFENDGPAVDTRLGAFDYAGNFSGWSEPKTVEGACGCEAAGADPARSHGYGLLALGVLGLAALRARRIEE